MSRESEIYFARKNSAFNFRLAVIGVIAIGFLLFGIAFAVDVATDGRYSHHATMQDVPHHGGGAQ